MRRLARVETPDGPFVALLSRDGSTLLPPGDLGIPGVSDPGLRGPLPMVAARLLAPIRPRTVVGIGRNYGAHARELGNEVPDRPLMFLKPPGSVVGPGDTILLPPDSGRVEHEAELGIVIGRRARHLSVDDALASVAGYVVVNDVTARDLQRRDGQFTRAKGFDTFCPVGPWLHLDFDPRDAEVICEVNGEPRQRGRTSDMVFHVATLVAAVSRVMTLEPGDLIASGTPEGVGPLADGDVVECRIEGLGSLRNRVARDPEASPARKPIGEG